MESEQEDNVTIDDLPEEVLLKTFEFLKETDLLRSTEVCKKLVILFFFSFFLLKN